MIAKLGDTHSQGDKLLATNGMRQPRGEGERAVEVWTFAILMFQMCSQKKSLIMFPMIFHNNIRHTFILNLFCQLSMCSSRCSQYHWDISNNLFCPKLKSLNLLGYIHETKRKCPIILSWECKLLFLGKCTEFEGDSVVVMGQGEVTRCTKNGALGPISCTVSKNTY